MSKFGECWSCGRTGQRLVEDPMGAHVYEFPEVLIPELIKVCRECANRRETIKMQYESTNELEVIDTKDPIKDNPYAPIGGYHKMGPIEENLIEGNE